MKRVAGLIILLFISFYAETEISYADMEFGLTAYYPFNGNADDESGNGNHGALAGPTLTKDRFGNSGSAYSFDENRYIRIGRQEDVLPLENCTVTAWFKKTGTFSGTSAIIGGSDVMSPFLGFVDGTPTWGDSPDKDFLTPHVATGFQKIADTEWHHIAGTFEHAAYAISYITLYVDGEWAGSEDCSIKRLGLRDELYIGFQKKYGPNYFTGAIDDVRIYRRALSSSEIREIYNCESQKDCYEDPVYDVTGTWCLEESNAEIADSNINCDISWWTLWSGDITINQTGDTFGGTVDGDTVSGRISGSTYFFLHRHDKMTDSYKITLSSDSHGSGIFTSSYIDGSDYCSTEGDVTLKRGTCEEQDDYSWFTGNWSSCSESCGYGTQSRTVGCRDSSGNAVADSRCSGSKPSGTQSCYNDSGCEYSWQTGEWGSCDCDSKEQTRTVECIDDDGHLVNDINCHDTRPTDSKNCSCDSSGDSDNGGGGGCFISTCGGR